MRKRSFEADRRNFVKSFYRFKAAVSELSDGSLLLNMGSINGDPTKKSLAAKDGGMTWSQVVEDARCLNRAARPAWKGTSISSCMTETGSCLSNSFSRNQSESLPASLRPSEPERANGFCGSQVPCFRRSSSLASRTPTSSVITRPVGLTRRSSLSEARPWERLPSLTIIERQHTGVCPVAHHLA
jgi:hypothetical protein